MISKNSNKRACALFRRFGQQSKRCGARGRALSSHSRSPAAPCPSSTRAASGPSQVAAIRQLEQSFAANRPMRLVQMPTGSGKSVLFEGGRGETVRRKVLLECDVHTLLRLATRIFYAKGVNAKVSFFARMP